MQNNGRADPSARKGTSDCKMPADDLGGGAKIVLRTRKSTCFFSRSTSSRGQLSPNGCKSLSVASQAIVIAGGAIFDSVGKVCPVGTMSINQCAKASNDWSC